MSGGRKRPSPGQVANPPGRQTLYQPGFDSNALLNKIRSSEQYQAMNSSIACRYTRRVSFCGKLFRTADLA
jgi:hypothetical protein